MASSFITGDFAGYVRSFTEMDQYYHDGNTISVNGIYKEKAANIFAD
jgi:hypothetical protein